jgi:hypothetical protein
MEDKTGGPRRLWEFQNNEEITMSTQVQVLAISTLEVEEQAVALKKVASFLFNAWGDKDPDYGSRDKTLQNVTARLNGPDRDVFMLTVNGVIAATASADQDDWGHILLRSDVRRQLLIRDLYVHGPYRGQVIEGLLAWQLMLKAVLEWARARQVKSLAALTIPEDADRLYKLGAKTLRTLRLTLSDPAPIQMLSFDVDETLDKLKKLAAASQAVDALEKSAGIEA